MIHVYWGRSWKPWCQGRSVLSVLIINGWWSKAFVWSGSGPLPTSVDRDNQEGSLKIAICREIAKSTTYYYQCFAVAPSPILHHLANSSNFQGGRMSCIIHVPENRLKVCVPLKLMLKPSPQGVPSPCGVFERWLSHEGGTLTSGIIIFVEQV
jgi:hypothetical protein